MTETTLETSAEDLLWPRYADPEDLAAIESVPLAARGLPESTYALLVRAAARWPRHDAITVLPEAARWREPLRRSYGELLADVHRYANLLHELGVRRGDAVALIAPNCAELIPATLAAQLAGIAAPINGGLSRDHIAELLGRSGARILIVAGPELAAESWACARELAARGLVDALLVLRPTAAADHAPELPAIAGVRVGYLDAFAAEQDSSRFVGVPPTASDLAALFHTGGTTGVPKLAAHRHSGEVANAWMIAANSLLDEDAVVFAALPLFHVNALVVTLLAPLFRGQSVVWAGPLGYRDFTLYAEFWNIVAHYRIAAMSAVPTVYAVLAQCPIDADISSLRYAMVGASPLPPAVRENFQTHTGVTLVEGYGLTEATCASARSFPDRPRPGAVGQRMPYQHVAVVRVAEDGTWETLPVGETGVLIISGPTVFAGYVTGRDERGHLVDGLGTLVDGRLNTGDLAHIDDDGFIHLHGRAKDLIIRGGHNIDPATIEDALLRHPRVTAAGAVGRPDAHSGEVPVAYVAVTAGADVSEDELVAWAAERVQERAAAPKTVTVLDALPVTDVGKPYKLGLRADATRRELLEALADSAGVRAVTAAVEDGAVVATVELDAATYEREVAAILGRYAITWKVLVAQ
ncbi:fatty-acyl-CoA synthase [Nocardia amikacinitolerans]|uniref:Fatty-acyl-CoA synthase n=1 Tax=Nocardia amikacinitolerans TaxID=756689 RepID=A0A285M100_9NOCA|nr:acyl-CoA synthetase [Nocardia amikacinitolerans]MCP2298697.1 fatty-acyl-CoA synthase [Nocardia amikacinitolerans]SNY89586.1 fatty-acyl-CoA synthase [Nocardia amikacinitolerans]